MKNKTIILVLLSLFVLTSTSVIGNIVKIENENKTVPYLESGPGLGLIYKKIPETVPRSTFSGEVPYEYFDWRDAKLGTDSNGNKVGIPGEGEGYDWTTPVKDQGACGSCYAFGSFGALESAIKISKNNPNLNIDLSEQFMVSCGSICYSDGDSQIFPSGINGCSGADFTSTFDFILEQGAISEGYFPYDSEDFIDTRELSQCGDKKSGWKNYLYKISDWGVIEGGDNSIKNALVRYGPLATTMMVHNNFREYDGGIYDQVSSDSGGGHMIVLVGWDEVNQSWICKNSWGDKWGEPNPYDSDSSGGWFRIKYGLSDINFQTGYLLNPHKKNSDIGELGLDGDYHRDANDTVVVRFKEIVVTIDKVETATKEDAFEIKNEGPSGSTLNWEITYNYANDNWVSDYSFSPSSGSLEGGETQKVDLSFRPVHGYGLDYDQLITFCRIENTDDSCADVIDFKVVLTIDHTKSKDLLFNRFEYAFPFLFNLLSNFLE